MPSERQLQAIKTHKLTRKFGEFTAVNEVTLDIEKGEIFGLLGPNGAGKTTLAKMLYTLLPPTSGYAELWGNEITSKPDRVRKCVGVVFQDPSVDTKLTGRENLDFHARMYGLEKREREKRIEEVLDLVDLKDKARVQVEAYSGGMQRRLEIARGLIHYPKVLFLDEPTLGLDVQTRRHIWEHVKRVNQEKGVTILLMTHYMEEAEYLCHRIGIIDQGRIISLDTPGNLKKLSGEDVISLGTMDSKGALTEAFRDLEGINWIEERDGSVEIGLEEGDLRIPEIVMRAYDKGLTIKSINLHKPNLEDVFLKLTGKRIREEEEGSDVQDIRRKVISRVRRRKINM